MLQKRAPRLRRRLPLPGHVLRNRRLRDRQAQLQQLAVDSGCSPDFLWFMSSDFFLRLPQLLPRHRREVVLVVIRCLALPHDEDDLQPLCTQRPERLAMRMSPRPLLVVVCPGPFTRTEREERDMIDYVPQRLVAGEAELHDALLAAPLRQGHGSSRGLEMPKRLPPLGGVAQAGPERRGRDAMGTDPERPNPLPRPHAGEKNLDWLPA